MLGVIGMIMNVACRLQKRGALAPRIFRTSEAWARKQHRDKREKHVELLLDAQLFQAAA